MESSKSLIFDLIAQRDILEIEANAILSELNSVGPNGQAPVGLKGSLVDNEGYPRNDIDIYNARAKRNRFAIINTDHKRIMEEIEKQLHLHHDMMEVSKVTQNGNFKSLLSETNEAVNSNLVGDKISIDNQYRHLRPISVINEILENSPAIEAGLVDGDLLLDFGGINCSTTNPLSSIPNIVGQNLGKEIKLIIKRENVIILTKITPKSWGGRGLLGLHLSNV